MKVGIIVDNELNNDIRVTTQINLLKKNGYDIHVLCFGFDNKEYDEIEGIHITRIRIKSKIKNALYFFNNLFPTYERLWARHIRRLIINHDLNLIHAHDLYMSRPAFIGRNKSKKNIPVIIDLHENFPHTISTYTWANKKPNKYLVRPEKWKNKEGSYLGYADKIIVLCKAYKDKLINEFPFLKPYNLIVLQNVPDLNQLSSYAIKDEEVTIHKEHPIIFYFGVIGVRRGIFQTLNVLKTLISSGNKVTLLLIGPIDKDDRAAFHSYLSEPDVKDFITYIPWIDLNMLPTYLKMSDICLCPIEKNPQHESGVANKIYQYMFGSRPIIASNCAPQKELIENVDCGIIYENDEQYAAAIIKLINDEKLRLEMGKRGRQALSDKYNIEEIGKSLLGLYNELKKWSN